MPRTKLPQGSVPVTFRLPRELQRFLREKAQREKTSFSALVRRALLREIGRSGTGESANRAMGRNHARQK